MPEERFVWLEGKDLGVVVGCPEIASHGIVVYEPCSVSPDEAKRFLKELYANKQFSHIPNLGRRRVLCDGIDVSDGVYKGQGVIHVEVRDDGVFEGYAKMVQEKDMGLRICEPPIGSYTQ